MDIQQRPSPDMVIDTVNEGDQPVGTILRREVLDEGLNFRVAHLFVFNTAGELLLQQLAPTRERHPLAWGSSVAAYLFAGETYDEAIRRRSEQELGRQIAPTGFLGRSTMQDLDSEKFIALFSATADGPFDYDKGHIANVEFLPVAEIERIMKTGERTFTPTFRHLFAFYLDTLTRTE